jgi:hypothetical protein
MEDNAQISEFEDIFEVFQSVSLKTYFCTTPYSSSADITKHI